MKLRVGEYEVRLILCATGRTQLKRRVFASTMTEAEMIARNLWESEGWDTSDSYTFGYYSKEAR